MKAQYPDHGNFNAQQTNLMSQILKYLSGLVAKETACCVMYVLVVVYTASHCISLISWVIGKPEVVTVEPIRASANRTDAAKKTV